MRHLLILIFFTFLIATSASAFKLQENEGSIKTIFKPELNEGGAKELLLLPTSDVVTVEESDRAKSLEMSKKESEEYLFGGLSETLKRVVEDIKKSLDNVGKHMEIPL
ncbi:uncharacterized protein LOC119178345 [Rhipicephalus microplus]|uniref:uncharacterized protein LOC119178345 n=1 Tax=Rhipicephalus microplus TaxID=6941 RepID=UPI0018872A7E|nr:uncharacterized protein LOC119178345 [Rhipicephalus microplus]